MVRMQQVLRSERTCSFCHHAGPFKHCPELKFQLVEPDKKLFKITTATDNTIEARACNGSRDGSARNRRSKRTEVDQFGWTMLF